MTVAVLVSSAPILRRGGHSQGWDEAAVDLGAYFGRLLIAVDYVAGFEARMAEATPLARYGAFIVGLADALPAVGRCYGRPIPTVWTLLGCEEERLRRDQPGEWAAGLALADAARIATAS